MMSDIVMNDEKNLAKLNAIVHPEVKEYIIHDIKRKNSDYKYYVIEAALLIQDGYRELCDEIWYIYADRQTRINRLMKWRDFTESKAVLYMDNQPDDAFFIENSDIVIDNSMDISSNEEEGMKKLKASLESALNRSLK
jgi:dephospho-CoA kinase